MEGLSPASHTLQVQGYTAIPFGIPAPGVSPLGTPYSRPSIAGIIKKNIISKSSAPNAVFEPRVLSLPGQTYPADGFDTSMYPIRVPASLPGFLSFFEL